MDYLGKKDPYVGRAFHPGLLSSQSRITISLVSLANNDQDHFGVGSMKYRALLTILFILMAIGIGLAVSQGANSSYLQTALSTFYPSQAAGSSCH